VEENATHLVVVDTASGGIFVAVLADSGPEVSLAELRVSLGVLGGGSIAGQGRT
jgi:hypothetical protein